MTDVSLLELIFPDQINRIRHMRKTHHGFETLCQDFDLLSAELERLEIANETTQACLNCPVTESLDGLAEEIAEHLSQVAQSDIIPKSISEMVPIFTQAQK